MVLGQSVIWFILCQRSIGGHHSLRKYWLYCSRYWRNKKMTRLHRLRYLSSKNWNGYIVLVTCPQKIETIITLILLPLLFLNWLNVMGTLFLILEKSEGFCFFVTNISVIVFLYFWCTVRNVRTRKIPLITLASLHPICNLFHIWLV
jgi:hypothetical protein